MQSYIFVVNKTSRDCRSCANLYSAIRPTLRAVSTQPAPTDHRDQLLPQKHARRFGKGCAVAACNRRGSGRSTPCASIDESTAGTQPVCMKDVLDFANEAGQLHWTVKGHLSDPPEVNSHLMVDCGSQKNNTPLSLSSAGCGVGGI
jgi:hypothetical protein